MQITQILTQNKKKYLTSFVLLVLVIILKNNLYAGRIESGSISSEQEYLLFIPATFYKEYKEGNIYPVAICLPGWGVKVKDDINVWKFAAEKKGLFLILPQIDYAKINSYDDLLQVEINIFMILEDVKRQYPVDNKRVFLAGTSAGGMFSINLALRYPDKFSGIGVISGCSLTRKDFMRWANRSLANAKGQRFYVIHGVKDPSVTITDCKTTIKKLENNGAIIKFEPVKEGAHTLPTEMYKKIIDWFASNIVVKGED